MEDPFKINGADGTNRICNMQEAEPNPNQHLGSGLLNEFNYLPWSRAVTIAMSMAILDLLILLHRLMKLGNAKINLSCPSYLTLWKIRLLKYSATQNTLWHYGK